jgi:hypothetical protein
MIYSIMPLVKEAGNNVSRAGAYAAALIVTAVALFAGVAALGSWLALHVAGLVPLAVAMLLYAAGEIGLLRVPLPSSHWQVPRSWIALGRLRGAALYGALMGAGFFTRAPFATYHALVAWALVAGSAPLGAILGFAFGCARAATLVLPRLQGAGGHVERTEFAYRRAAEVHVINGIVMAFSAATLLVLTLGAD